MPHPNRHNKIAGFKAKKSVTVKKPLMSNV